MRFFPLIFMLLLLTGCYTYIQAPGATGKVIDAETGAPVRHARVTRPPVASGLARGVIVRPEGIPVTTSFSDKSGHFNLAPAMHPQIAFMYLRNPKTVSGLFLISADGYATNEVRGTATSRDLWRVDLGKVGLKKP